MNTTSDDVHSSKVKETFLVLTLSETTHSRSHSMNQRRGLTKTTTATRTQKSQISVINNYILILYQKPTELFRRWYCPPLHVSSPTALCCALLPKPSSSIEALLRRLRPVVALLAARFYHILSSLLRRRTNRRRQQTQQTPRFRIRSSMVNYG